MLGRKELDFAQVKITNPGNRPLTPDVPAGVSSPTAMEYIESYLPYLMTVKRAEGKQYTYGQFLEHQIGEVLQMYREYGFNTNQAYMSVGDDRSIYLDDPPCLSGIDTRGGSSITACISPVIFDPGTFGLGFLLTLPPFNSLKNIWLLSSVW